MDLKTYISLLRKDMGLSQRELARKSQISHTEISRIEKGERDRPSPAVLKKLAPFLGVRVEQLMEVAGYIGLNTQEVGSAASVARHQEEYTFGAETVVDELPILNKNNGNESTHFDLKSLQALDFALRVADNSLACAGLYKGDLALCSRDTSATGAQVLVVESVGKNKRELALVLNKGTDDPQIYEPGLDSSGMVCDAHTIGKVVAAIRGMEWKQARQGEESQEEWLGAVNTAIKLGFTPNQVIWLLKKQAQFLKLIDKKA